MYGNLLKNVKTSIVNIIKVKKIKYILSILVCLKVSKIISYILGIFDISFLKGFFQLIPYSKNKGNKPAIKINGQVFTSLN